MLKSLLKRLLKRPREIKVAGTTGSPLKKEEPDPHIPTDNVDHVSQLPPEVLARIFAILGHLDALRTTRWGNAKLAHLGWVVVTHVCRRWRRVALEHALLWRCIPYPPVTEWTFQFIARSGDAPWMHRWCSLSGEIHLFDNEAIAHVSSLVEGPTISQLLAGSQLEVLDIFVDHSPMWKYALGYTPVECQKILPVDFLAVLNAPLRRIPLNGCRLPWTSPLFRNLTTLEIDGNMLPHQQREFDAKYGPLVGLLEMLEANPELEHLLLVDCLPPTIPSDHIATLPRLQSVKLGGSIVACAEVMQHVTIPSSARTQFLCHYDEKNALHAPLLRFIDERFAPSGTGKSPKVRTLMVKCGGIYSPVSVLGHDRFGPPDVDLTLPTEEDPRQLKKMCDALHLDELQAVYIDFAYNLSIPGLWPALFGGCASVRFAQLEASHDMAVSFCEAFVKPSVNDGASGDLFPELNALALRFSDTVDEYFSPSLKSSYSDLPHVTFAEKLKQRADRTLGFNTLYLQYRGVRTSFLPTIAQELSILHPTVTVIPSS
ncbi:hypothetical protein FA95DRAFT_1683128 [Auriscalpium vulgare]|uniref:Uncharacterized protein n=1 Tax=Auriscalpium vulgare TaxID=40419 RepID=A0ACB8RCA5_9AGAM|nr:hypothetical protein FA95DRAFT_1683128 [Auriscalpium vulgare]